MAVLVACASRYGATDGIARAIAEVLTEAGHDVTVASCDEAPDAAAFDAVVVGSAVYAGHWLEAAKEFVTGSAECCGPGPYGCSPAARSATLRSPARTRSTPRRCPRPAAPAITVCSAGSSIAACCDSPTRLSPPRCGHRRETSGTGTRSEWASGIAAELERGSVSSD